MYKRIVVALDGSEIAERALAEAEDLARVSQTPLHLLRVIDITHLERYGPYGLALEYASYDQVRTTEQAAAQDYLGPIVQRLLGEDLQVTEEIRTGLVPREVVAALHEGDVLVMASHGRTGVRRWLLGSVAEDVLRHAPVPVLLIRAGDEATTAKRAA